MLLTNNEVGEVLAVSRFDKERVLHFYCKECGREVDGNTHPKMQQVLIDYFNDKCRWSMFSISDNHTGTGELVVRTAAELVATLRDDKEVCISFEEIIVLEQAGWKVDAEWNIEPDGAWLLSATDPDGVTFVFDYKDSPEIQGWVINHFSSKH